MNQHLVIGTAGHIDHGKSSLVRALTGIDPDRLKEEKVRGITIDLGFAHTVVDDVRVAFVDVPGHERFVRNMLAGVTGIDAVLLVVAADESVMPQTREHFDICRLLRVRTGLVALTKCDVADPDLRELAALETRELVAGSFLEAAPIVEVSAVTGEGLPALRRELAALARRVALRPARGPVRLPIDRVFTLRGFGTVVTGTLVSGELQAEAPLALLPAGRDVRVRGLHVHGAAVQRVGPGERVAVNVGGDLQVDDLARGDALITPGAFEPTSRLDVRLELLADAPPLRHGTRVRVHQGTSEVMGRVAIASPIDETSGTPSALAPGGRAYARLRLERPIVAARGDRFVVRRYSPVTTIGGGLVLDAAPRRTPLRSAAARVRFEALDPGVDDPAAAGVLDRALDAIATEAGREGVSAGAAAVRLQVGPDAVQAAAARLGPRRLVAAGDVLLSTTIRERLDAELHALLEAHHAAAAPAEGVPREEARDRLRLPARLFDWLLEAAIAAQRVAGRDRLVLPGRAVGPTPEERARAERVAGALARAGLKAPDLAELAQQAGCTDEEAERALSWLGRERVVVRTGGLPFHRDTLDRLKADVRAHRAEHDGRIDVATFKARYDLTRKHAIPLLEYLDRERVTRRVGDVRIVI